MTAIFDGHNDALTREDHTGLVRGRSAGHLDLPRMRRGGMRGGISAIFSPSPDASSHVVTRPDGTQEVPYAPPVAQADAAVHARAAAERLPQAERAGHVRLARAVADVDAALTGAGPPAAVLHLEGAEAIDPGLEALRDWYALGLRSLGPVWSRANAFASGVPFRFPSSPDTGPGLTDAGRALVRPARRQPCGRPRALPDLAQPHGRAARRDRPVRGLVGIVFAVAYLRSDLADDPVTPLERIVEHARHVRDRVGMDHVALGSDFDGATVPAALGDVAGLPRLLEAFRAGGLHPDELEALAGRNWRRVLAAWWRD